jgi:phosphoribosylamine-glycine ligase
MKFQVISERGQGVGIAAHLSSEGHAVAIHVEYSKHPVGKGVAIYASTSGAADIILFDSDIFGEFADELRAKGQRVAGASSWGQALSSNREYSHVLIRSLGWPIYEKLLGHEFCISAWFNGNTYIGVYVSVIQNKLFSDVRSPSVPYAGIVSDFWIDKSSKVYGEILTPLSKMLKRVNHRGLVNVFVRANNTHYTVYDVNATLTSPLALPFYENSRESVSNILLGVFNEGSHPIAPLERWAGALLLSTPPYPYKENVTSVPISGVEQGNLRHLWFEDVMHDKGTWSTAGDSGRIGYVTARGSAVHEMQKRVYRTTRNVTSDSIQFREDLCKDTGKVFSMLAQSGWTKRKQVKQGGESGQLYSEHSNVGIR